jgi:biotin transporter BioY
MKILLSTLVSLIVPVIFWCGGYNFERNETGGFCAFWTVMVFMYTYLMAHIWEENNK